MPRFRLGWGPVVVLCVVAVVVAIEVRPKKMPLSVNPAMVVGYYWGSSRIGRHFYRVKVDEGRYGWWEVAFRRVGYNPYRGYYPDGKLRDEGEMQVRLMDQPPQPVPDPTDVNWGDYYMPDGSLGAQVRDGTGEQKLWYPNGKLRWKLVLRGHKRVLCELWFETGDLLTREWYDESGKVMRTERGAKAEP